MDEKIFNAKFQTKTGWLCLDFANTVDWHSSANPEEKLSTYRDLVFWARDKKAITAEQAGKLLAASEKEPATAQKTLDFARELREAIYNILVHFTHGQTISSRDLSILNTAMVKLLPNMRIITNTGFDWEWIIDDKRLDSLLGPVVWSAIELLTTSALERVGQCADENCGWLFWDTSRNRTRRWCDMQDCGNRAKSRRHYRKEHSKSSK